jgi:hypothetical protein
MKCDTGYYNLLAYTCTRPPDSLGKLQVCEYEICRIVTRLYIEVN